MADYEASGWSGVFAAKNTPVAIIDRLNKEIGAGLADPKIRARLTQLGIAVVALTPSGFGKFIGEETEVGQGGEVRGHQAGVTRRSRRHVP